MRCTRDTWHGSAGHVARFTILIASSDRPSCSRTVSTVVSVAPAGTVPGAADGVADGALEPGAGATAPPAVTAVPPPARIRPLRLPFNSSAVVFTWLRSAWTSSLIWFEERRSAPSALSMPTSSDENR